MPGKKQGGPIEVRLRASTRKEICALYDCSNQELLAIMEQEIERPGEEFDEELFDAAQSLLDERAPIGEQVDGETACQEFMEAHANLFQQEGGDQDGPTEKKHRRSFRQIVRTTLIAAALMLGIFCLGAVATGRDPFVIVSDAGETLIRNVTWGPAGTLTLDQPVDGYNSLEDALGDYNATDAQIITWIPKEFELETIMVQQVPNKEGVSDFKLWAYYCSNEEDLVYGIASISYIEENRLIEKDLGDRTVLFINGEEYHVVQNINRIQAYWSKDGYNYSLTGEIPLNEMKKILQSLK